MSDFFELLKFVFAVLMGTAVIFLTLIALPKSRLRVAFMTVVSWGMKLLALFCLVYAISPLDLIPDAVPVAGFADDLLALIIGTASAIGGFASSRAASMDNGKIIDKRFVVLPEENID